MRERSYASEPGSRILLKLDDEKEKIVPDLGLASDHDEDDDTIECDLGMRTSTLSNRSTLVVAARRCSRL